MLMGPHKDNIFYFYFFEWHLINNNKVRDLHKKYYLKKI